MKCRLCDRLANQFFTDSKTGFKYYHCSSCDLRFLDPIHFLPEQEELMRYQLHNNDIADVNYQNFVKPIVELVTTNLPNSGTGLDFGCGPGPVLAKMLTDLGYQMTLYDPYFYPDAKALTQTYDFVVATEVVEHFYSPKESFGQLAGLLLPGGCLGIMTSIFDENTDFSSWYYRRDPTHVCFYSLRTFDWIKGRYGFSQTKFSAPRSIWLS